MNYSGTSQEKWWLEYDPPKANYISGQGRGPFGGNSIVKQNWPRQMIPIDYKKKWERREKLGISWSMRQFQPVPLFRANSCGVGTNSNSSYGSALFDFIWLYMWLFFLTLYRRALASAWTPAPRKHRYAFRKHGYELSLEAEGRGPRRTMAWLFHR